MAVASVFGTAELLEAILAELELKQLHVLQRVNSSFKELINTSPTLKAIALWTNGFPEPYNRLRQNPALRWTTFVVGSKGSYISFPPVMRRISVNVTSLAAGHGERVRALWEEMRLKNPDERFRCPFSDQMSGYSGFIELEAGSTMKDLVDAVVMEVKKVNAA